MKEIIILIVGRTGTGKDTLARELAGHGLKQVKSYATRPKRFPEEDTHIFISQAEADAATDKVARTVIGPYEYFATRQQVEEADIYIIDPAGLYELTANMPDTEFVLVYLTADPEKAREHAMLRAADPEKEGAVYDARTEAESAQFTAFEERLDRAEPVADNIGVVYRQENHYDEPFTELANTLRSLLHYYSNCLAVTHALAKAGAFSLMEGDKVQLWRKKDGKLLPEMVSQARCAMEMAGDDDNIGYCMRQYLALPEVTLT